MMPKSSITPNSSKPTCRWHTMITLAAVTALCTLSGGCSPEENQISAEVKAAHVGDLLITVTARGELKAAKSEWVRSQIEANSPIIKIIEEGTRVNKGDWLFTLDTTSLEKEQQKQDLAVERAQSSHEQARAAMTITEKQNESEISKADLEKIFARIDLEKFTGGDEPEKGDRMVQLEEYSKNIKLAREEKRLAGNKLDDSKNLAQKEYITKNELEQDQLSFDRADLNLKMKLKQLANFKKYDLTKQLEQLEANLKEANLNLIRVKERCRQKLIQTRTDLNSKKRQLVLEEERQERIKQQIHSGKMKAPGAGLVVYANQGGQYRRGRADPIAEGTSVRYHQKVISLPDVRDMIVEVNIHESARSQLWRGQEATIQIEALKGKIFRGTLVKVPEVADSSSSWLTPDRKVYKVRVKVHDTSDKVRPGMSARVTVYCEKVNHVLLVPIQAVFQVDRDTRFLYVKNNGSFQTRMVEVGKHNDKYVQITSGLKEGELVYLSEPLHAVRPQPKADHGPDEIPEGVKVSTSGKPKTATKPASENKKKTSGSSRRGNMDPARMLKMIQKYQPDFYKEIKDLPPAEQKKRISEQMKKRRGGGGKK